MESLVKKCPLENSLYETKLSYYSITALHLEVGVCLYQCSTNQVLAFNRVRFESFRVLCKFDINHVLSFDLNPSQNTQSCIKGLLVVCTGFLFLGHLDSWASTYKKSWGANYEQLLRAIFLCFWVQFFFF